jgi:hypothetical protein
VAAAAVAAASRAMSRQQQVQQPVQQASRGAALLCRAWRCLVRSRFVMMTTAWLLLVDVTHTAPAHPSHPSTDTHHVHTHRHTAGLLSLDTDGRVVRVDTFAKLLGPGYRLGWVAGPRALVNRVALHTAAVSVGACSTSQVRGRVGMWARGTGS